MAKVAMVEAVTMALAHELEHESIGDRTRRGCGYKRWCIQSDGRLAGPFR